MILRIIFTKKGIKLLDYYTLPPDVIDCINHIVYHSTVIASIKDDEILVPHFEMSDILYSLSNKFDLLIKRG